MKDAGHRAVLCRCDCGTEQAVLVFALRSGQSSSCGCWKRERTAQQAEIYFVTHGRARRVNGRQDPLYALWKRIKRRCHNPKAHNYRWYGGRGIALYEPWRNDAGAFIAWIEANLGPRPAGHTIDRIENHGDYAPGNLQWLAPSVNSAKSQAERDDANRARGTRLPADEVREILARLAAGTSQRRLEAELGVSRRTIGRIVTGETWRHDAPP